MSPRTLWWVIAAVAAFAALAITARLATSSADPAPDRATTAPARLWNGVDVPAEPVRIVSIRPEPGRFLTAGRDGRITGEQLAQDGQLVVITQLEPGSDQYRIRLVQRGTCISREIGELVTAPCSATSRQAFVFVPVGASPGGGKAFNLLGPDGQSAEMTTAGAVTVQSREASHFATRYAFARSRP
jgi:hypothetical protein